jgi:flagellar basal-body rod modification protein FlgD
MVDSVSPVSNQPKTTATTNSQKASLDYDMFLQLLIAEMKNQDPLQPMNSSEYVAQLGTFSNVEQSIVTNNKLDELMSATMLSQAGSIIGKHITSADGETAGVVESVRFITGGAVAVIEGGKEVLLSPGTVLTDAGADTDA